MKFLESFELPKFESEVFNFRYSQKVRLQKKELQLQPFPFQETIEIFQSIAKRVLLLSFDKIHEIAKSSQISSNTSMHCESFHNKIESAKCAEFKTNYCRNHSTCFLSLFSKYKGMESFQYLQWICFWVLINTYTMFLIVIGMTSIASIWFRCK
jgi:hypothetical protein